MPTPPTSLCAPGFALDAAIFLAQAAKIAYQPDPSRQRVWAQQQSLPAPLPFDTGNIQGFALHGDHFSLLASRGTSNLGQWIRDANIAPVDHPWGDVHQGFLDGLAAVDSAIDAFTQAAASAKPLWITGHSLGGALAVLAAARLHMHGLAPRTVTFGQPRTGSSAFATRFDAELPQRLLRFINQSDLIPRLPPGSAYRHCGAAKRIVRPGLLEMIGMGEVAPASLSEREYAALTADEYQDLLRQLDAGHAIAEQGGCTAEGSLPWFGDHSINEYIRLLVEIHAKQEAHLV